MKQKRRFSAGYIPGDFYCENFDGPSPETSPNRRGHFSFRHGNRFYFFDEKLLTIGTRAGIFKQLLIKLNCQLRVVHRTFWFGNTHTVHTHAKNSEITSKKNQSD
uniref:(northern house mosquito) hypothetical protein n=1 Tax=Culex pipiens TaxID=7175 RepID=A0A8D8EQ22_CULPI